MARLPCHSLSRPVGAAWLIGLVLLAPAPMAAQELTLQLAARMLGATALVAADGSYVCAANGAVLTVIDVTRPESPLIRGRLTLPDRIWDLVLVGLRAYVAIDDGLQIVDIADPAAPKVVGVYRARGQTVSVALSGSLAFTTSNMTGLDVLDVSDPSNPRLVSSHMTEGFSRDVAAFGPLAFVADQPHGLFIVDAKAPNEPTELGRIDTVDVAQQIVVAATTSSGTADRAYLLDAATGTIEILDVSTPASPMKIGNYKAAGRISSIYAVGPLVYLTLGAAGVQVVDLTNPSAPVVKATFETSGNAQSISVTDSLVVVADRDGLVILKQQR